MTDDKIKPRLMHYGIALGCLALLMAGRTIYDYCVMNEVTFCYAYSWLGGLVY